MKKIFNLAIFIFFSHHIVYGQPVFEAYNFNDETPEIPESFSNENEVYLQKNVKIQIMNLPEGGVTQYALIHEKIQLNSNDAIERNNRVYIPFRNDEEILTNKLRVVLKNGTVVLLDEKDIKEEVDEERGVKYNYYAVNGLEVGCIIEKIFILQQYPDLRGNSIQIQSEKPILEGSFELIYPKHLGFQYKSYNGLPEATFVEDAYEDTSTLTVNVKNLKGLPDNERYSNWQKHVQSFKYKLYENFASNNKNLNNYKEFAGNVYDNLHVELDKKAKKAIENFAKGISKENTQLKQIQAIESYVKNNIQYNRYFDTNEKLEDVFKSKQANQFEILKIFLSLFEMYAIPTEMVFTCDRFSLTFDPEFESIENLRDILLFFPETKNYLDPTSFEYRTPLFDNNYGNNYGLFIKEKEFGGVKMGIGVLDFIEIPNEITHDYMNIVVDFSENLENPTITTEITFGGYAAMNFQPLKDFMPPEEYQKILKEISENYTASGEIIKIETENDGLEFVGKKPFVFKFSFEGENLTQKAGPNILFKIGETIGSQMEFYQEEQRVLPVEIYYPHYYTRSLKVIIPEGYHLKSTEPFNMNFNTEIEEKEVAAFTSNAKIENKTLVVTNEEFYTVIDYPLEYYESYKKVINAAADFNKIVIVLEKD